MRYKVFQKKVFRLDYKKRNAKKWIVKYYKSMSAKKRAYNALKRRGYMCRY